MPTKPKKGDTPPETPLEMKVLLLRRYHAETMVELFRAEEELEELKARRASIEADLKTLTGKDNPYA